MPDKRFGGGVLVETMKLRRAPIAAEYAEQIALLYAEETAPDRVRTAVAGRVAGADALTAGM
ncbi:hypothetical protein LTT66_33510 [Nocardia gipuzkoensis]|uniref:hypothetical protein n=1 Tax=Nocardia gipuzkoensis TaxID=2749991 RepID=UPI001E29F7FA|nr:hypothetical protein [Nocardia gipuzkoensis]UGT68029.1 hypothetical protein LTT66_33510 [Nocardia gipuzkoensis]